MVEVRNLPEYQKFVQCVREHQLLTPESFVIAAVSGGADSVCMLLFLCAYLPATQITVAHMNHGIRGAEAERDAEFVRQLAAQFNVEAVFETVDIPVLSRKAGTGIEETARIYRYAFLQRIADRKGALIAVAHNKEDRAETVLMNIARGTSIDGLKGISYRNDNVIRPVLDLSRKEIESVCTYIGITPMTDSTNLTDFTLRNKVRHCILPYLSREFGHDLTPRLLSLAAIAEKDTAFMEQYTKSRMEKMLSVTNCHGEARIRLNRKAFVQEAEAVQYRIVRSILSRVSGTDALPVYPNGKDLTGDIIRRILEHVLFGGSGRKAEAGRGVYCRIEHGDALFFLEKTDGTEDTMPCLIEQPEMIILPRGDFTEEELISPKKGNYELFDVDTLREISENLLGSIVLRSVQSGDRFFPFGAKGSTTLQKFLINQKIPISMRRNLRVVAAGSEVLWIPGIRRSERGRITEYTTNILTIQFKTEVMNYELQ